MSSSGEGELSPSETRLAGNKQPMVMDFIEMPLARHVGDPLQPENWLIASVGRWRLVNSLYQQPGLELLREEPANIWLQRDERVDRVSPLYLKKRPPVQSLYMIHMPGMQARFEWNEWDGRYKQRRRALFTYRGVKYELNITDPAFCDRYRTQFPAKGQPSKTFSVTPPNGCYLCVSLAPEFNGFHYKVVATIIEAPNDSRRKRRTTVHDRTLDP
ncbi:MAG: hypothetical protein J5I93_29550 [Pirellulaceae bacterium]|nr:hypothetical protein [Pirellulaceae bacterium]